jgi:ATP-binding cassette subfamily C protein
MDLPWMPLYLVICAMIHPLIGLMVAGGALILVGLAFATDSITRAPIRLVSETGSARMTIAEATRRNAEVVTAMGMGAGVSAAFDRANRAHLDANDRAADASSTLGTFAKIFRMALQSAVLGVGAYLVINQQATGGVILASSILSARALAPIDQAIAHWRGFVGARQSWTRLSTLLANAPGNADILPLEAPTTRLTVEGMSITVPGLDRVVVRDVSFGIDGGTALGIIGPSASGKSSLARALVGIWRPARGSVRLDGASLDQWTPDALGRHVGYLPQSIELFDGTVAQNIARFYPDADPRAVLKAAEGAGVHDMIVRLPQGYETRLGEGGAALSGGQRQRIGLARALYGDPFLLVLDEPNSNLDGEGEQALNAAVHAVKARGGIAVVIAHRAGALAAVDTVMLMADGAARAIGPKDEVLRTLMRPAEPSRPRLHVQAGAA